MEDCDYNEPGRFFTVVSILGRTESLLSFYQDPVKTLQHLQR